MFSWDWSDYMKVAYITDATDGGYEAQDNNGHHADLHCMPNGQMFKWLYSTHSSHNNQHKMPFRNKCEAKKGLRHRNAKQTTTTKKKTK